MFDIESLAKEIFERFSLEETGRSAKWQYLNPERQQAWKRDVILIADKLLGELRKDIKPPLIINSKTQTSFNLGYLAGKNEERVMMITLLQKYHEELIKEYLEE